MNTNLKFSTAVIFGLMLAAASARAQSEGEDGENSKKCRKPHHGQGDGNREGMYQKLLEKFDKDGDGKLSEDEREAACEAMKNHEHGERREKMLEKFDKDGDGKLSEDEREAARKEMKKHGHCDKQGEGRSHENDEGGGGDTGNGKDNHPSGKPPANDGSGRKHAPKHTRI